MRIDTHIVHFHLVNYLLQANIGVAYDGGDIILCDLPGGEVVSIHLIERFIDVEEIERVFARNSAINTHTLFFLWCDMFIPDDGDRYRPADWMALLLRLYDGRIYAFKEYGSEALFFPAHFSPLPGGQQQVSYGTTVDFRRLRGSFVQMASGEEARRWFSVNFEGQFTERIFHDDEAGAHQETHHYEQAQMPPLSTELRDYYTVLKISPDASREEIRSAYRDLARQYHPDLNSSPTANARMQEVNAAYRAIMRSLPK
jgi:DnaJ-domain-containing protein 1